MKTFLRVWLSFVASLRILSVFFGYVKPHMLKENVFSIAGEKQITSLAARNFGIWTLLSNFLTVMCVLDIESGPLYRTTMGSFIIALIYFALEVGVFRTVDVRSAVAPGVIATLSLTLMAAGYSSIVVGAGGKRAKKN